MVYNIFKKLLLFFINRCDQPQDPLRQIAIGLFDAVKTIQGNNWIEFYNGSTSDILRNHLNKLYGI